MCFVPVGELICGQVYLITEVGVTPHNLRQGRNAPSIESAYQSVIQDLVSHIYSSVTSAWQTHQDYCRNEGDMTLGSVMRQSSLCESTSAAWMN